MDLSAFFEFRQKQEKSVEAALRRLLGHCCKPLSDAGLVTAQNSEWENIQSPLPRYKYGFSPSPEMQAVYKEYTDAAFKVHSSIEMLKRAKQEKAEAEAKNLWDQA